MLLSLVFSTLAATAVASPLQNRQSTVATGVAIFKCTKANTIALTFDDGPYIFGDTLLNTLDSYGAKATFFMNGNNWDTLESQAPYVQRAYAEGHQIASHTENHAHLAALDAAGVAKEMTDAEARFVTVIGKIPTYMRPPYLEYNADTLTTLGSLGYHVIDIDIDTKDYEGDYTAAINNFNTGLAAGGSIVLMHEVYSDTVTVLLPQVLEAVKASGKTAVTVGECLGDAAANWYAPPRGSTTTTTSSAATSTTTSSSSSSTSSASATTTSSASSATTTSASSATTSSGSAATSSSAAATSTTSKGATSTSSSSSYATSAPGKSCKKSKKRHNLAH